MDATTLADVKASLRLASTDATSDALIGDIITQVSGLFESYLARGLQSAARNEYFNPDYFTRMVHVSSYPVAASPAPQVWNDMDRAWGSNTLIDPTLYTFDPDTGAFYFDRTGLVGGYRYLKISYTGGMAADTAALKTTYPEIAYAARMQVCYEFRRRDSYATQAIALGGGNFTVDGPVKLLDKIKETLDRYKRIFQVMP